jgi:hypothetical protein
MENDVKRGVMSDGGALRVRNAPGEIVLTMPFVEALSVDQEGI